MPTYAITLAEHARMIVAPTTSVVIHGLKPETYGADYAPLDAIKYQYLELLNELQIIDAALTAERGGYDAVAIGCIFDPALRVARSLVDLPVVSLAETCMLVACSVAKRFAVVTMTREESAVVEQLADDYGLSTRLAGVVTMEPPVDEYALEVGLEGGEASQAAFDSACARAFDQGAELVIPGDGVLNEFLFRRRRFSGNGVPVMDSIGVLLNYAEMMAHLHASRSVATSRAGVYMKPPAAVVEYARQFAGLQPIGESEFSAFGPAGDPTT